jgi:hypothetical protein
MEYARDRCLWARVVRACGLLMLVLRLRILRVAALFAFAVVTASCAFEPHTRPVKQERLMGGPVRVMRTLDPYGVHAVLRYANDDGDLKYAITDWRAGDRCELPDDAIRFYTPLKRTDDLSAATEHLIAPVIFGATPGERQPYVGQLWVTNEHCELVGPLADIQEGGVPGPATVTSTEDQRDLFLFVSQEGSLSLLDSAKPDVAVHIADGVRGFIKSSTGSNSPKDVVWVLEGNRLTQRGLDGSLHVSLGDEVTSFDIFSSLTPRVVYIDGGDLFEAVAPEYVPMLRARDACDPHYSGSHLDLHIGCSEDDGRKRQLVRFELSSFEVKTFEPGVFSSVTIENLQFDYLKDTWDETAPTRLFVQFPGKNGKRQEITPVLVASTIVVLGNDRIAGQVDEPEDRNTFGIWQVTPGIFVRLFSGIELLVPWLDSTTKEYLWFMQHDENDGLFTLSVFTQTDLTLKTIATGVPSYYQRGVVIDGGRYIPKFPFQESILVYEEDCTELTFSADKRRFKGRLRAQLLSGSLSADLAEDVSSFVIVAHPLPGILYGIEEGPNAGLWFSAL